jgi:hypothetical protein
MELHSRLFVYLSGCEVNGCYIQMPDVSFLQLCQSLKIWQSLPEQCYKLRKELQVEGEYPGAEKVKVSDTTMLHSAIFARIKINTKNLGLVAFFSIWKSPFVYERVKKRKYYAE